jgi:hypothetical protein
VLCGEKKGGNDIFEGSQVFSSLLPALHSFVYKKKVTATGTRPSGKQYITNAGGNKRTFEPTLIESAWEKCQTQNGFIHTRVYSTPGKGSTVTSR